MVVNAVGALDQDELNEKLIGMKKVPGGGLQDSMFVDGVAFKKTASTPDAHDGILLTFAVRLCWFRAATKVIY